MQHPFFDTRWTNWVGLVTRKPVTEDYAPRAALAGRDAVGAGRRAVAAARSGRGWLTGALPRPLRPLAALGRWSLSFYMVHQPVLIGAMMAVVALRR